MFKAWLGNEHFPGDLMVVQFGGVSPQLMGAGFKMLRPIGDVTAYSGLWFNLHKEGYVPVFKAMNRWANDFVAMPGRFFRQLRHELYYRNSLLKGELQIKGQRVDLGQIHQPIFVAAASKDHIVPLLAAQRIMEAVGSTDKEFLELPGGHISVFSGRQAHKILWPAIDAWLAQRAA